MKNNDPDGERATRTLERRRMLEQLASLAMLSAIGACSSDEPGETPVMGAPPALPGPPTGPAAASGAAGALATPTTPARATPAPGGARPPATIDSTGGPGMAAPTTPSVNHAEPPRAACEVIVPSFPSLADAGPSTRFTRMDESNTADWIAIGGATSRLAGKVPDGILNLLRSLDKLYLGYPISVLAHSLQTATRAQQANASDDLVLCALCHDIGVAITVHGHAELSAAIVRGYVSDNAYRVVRHHTEFEWLRGGAPAGAPSDPRAVYQSQPWYRDAARFIDDWEQLSYDPKFSARRLEDFEDLVRSKFSAGGAVNDTTSKDCLPSQGNMP